MITEAAVLAALPPNTFLEKFVKYAMTMTEAHASFHAIGGLSALTQVVPSEYHIPFAAKIYTNLYGLTIATSSSGKKSTAVKIAKGIIHEVKTTHVMEMPGSDEGFIEQLRKQPHAILVYEEFGDFLIKASEGYFERLKGTLLSVYDGSPIGRALAKSQRGSVDNPRFTMLGAVANDILDVRTTDDDWTSGFLARFFCAYGLPERRFKRQPVENAAARLEVVNTLKARSDNLKRLGTCLWLDAEAEELWDEWYDYKNQWAEQVPKEMKPAYQRSEGFLQKICMLLAWDMGIARQPDPWHIDREILSYAVRIVDIHLQSLAELATRLAGNRDMRYRRAVLDAIRADRPTAVGEITRAARMLKNRQLNDILETLVEEGCIQRVNKNNRLHYMRTNAEGLALAGTEVEGMDE
jgi:hypothetical protein